MKTKKVLFLPGTKYGPAARFRYFQLKKPFLEKGIKTIEIILRPVRTKVFKFHFVNMFFSLARVINAIVIIPILPFFHAVVTIRDIVPNENVFFLEKLYHKFSRKFIVDFDDSFFHGGKKRKAINTLKCADAIVVGNDYLLNFSEQYNKNTFLIPTVIDTIKFKPLERRNKTDIPVIVWTGSKGTRLMHLPLIFPTLNMLSVQRKFIFRVIADEDPFRGINLNANIITDFIQWTELNEVAGLSDADIGVMPLQKNEFELGKCGFKLIQYGAVGIPSLATNWGVNYSIIDHKKTGFLCENDNDWINYLVLLLDDHKLRSEMGLNARAKICESFSVSSAINRWYGVLK